MRLFNMRSDKFEDVGHWKRRSALGLAYDSEECVLEGGVNQGKCVCAAFAGGWRRVGAACLPNPAPMAPSGNFAMLGALVLRIYFRRPTFCRSSCSSSCGWGFQYGYTGLTYVTATVRGAELLHCVQKLKMRQPTRNHHARFLLQIVPLGAVHLSDCSDCNILEMCA